MAIDKRKPLVELEGPNGSVKAFWPSAKAASEHYGIHQVNISYNVNGITKQAKGHYFRFATTEEIINYQNLLDNIDQDVIAQPDPVTHIEIPEEHIEAPADLPPHEDGSLSPFEKLLQKSKNIFKENSE
jgi:hypothetical protein